MTNEKTMTNKEAIDEIKSMGLIIDAMTHGTRRKSIYEALDLAIKALHIVEIIKEELSPAHEDITIFFDNPYFEEIQERAEKRADKKEKEDD